jgi:hypothetical protein
MAESNFFKMGGLRRFQNGNRIRITVAFADADNFETSVIDPPPELYLLRGRSHSSFVQLPMVQSQ